MKPAPFQSNTPMTNGKTLGSGTFIRFLNDVVTYISKPLTNVTVAAPDAEDAPVSYSQAQMQEVVDLAAANKAAINALTEALREKFN